MPKRTDISTILIIGAGPIVIGQACEFDYSGTQACKALKAEGYRIVLVNSNPATIMTDPDLADATYIEPITPEIVAEIIEKERNVTPGRLRAAPDHGRADRAQLRALAAPHGHAGKVRRRDDRRDRRRDRQGRGPRAVPRRDDQDRPRDAALEARQRLGAQAPGPRPLSPRARAHRRGATSARRRRRRRSPNSSSNGRSEEPERRERYQDQALIEALQALDYVGLPAIIRPSFTLGGTGGGIAYTKAEFLEIVERGLDASPTNEVLIEESVLGWKEFEMEVVRDKARQLHHHLLDRELRSDGRAHRRLDHHRAGADADRQGIPDHARRLDRGAARDRGRDRRLERAVRRQPGRRPPGRDRDEPARVALLRARLQGDRLSDRQGRRQARGRLHARRDRQRHHRRRDARLVRADHRLRGHEDPALRVREIPRRRRRC